MRVGKAVCVACRHEIDTAAKLCPYCGADPKTGQKADTQALLREASHEHPSKTSVRILDLARRRQGIVVAVGIVIALAILAALHQFVTARNATAVSSGPAVPLSDIADFGGQPNEAAQLPMPPLQFQYDGNPHSMRTGIVEPGAVTPPDVAAAQPAAAQKMQSGPATPHPSPAVPRPNGAAPTPPRSQPR